MTPGQSQAPFKGPKCLRRVGIVSLCGSGRQSAHTMGCGSCSIFGPGVSCVNLQYQRTYHYSHTVFDHSYNCDQSLIADYILVARSKYRVVHGACISGSEIVCFHIPFFVNLMKATPLHLSPASKCFLTLSSIRWSTLYSTLSALS